MSCAAQAAYKNTSGSLSSGAVRGWRRCLMAVFIAVTGLIRDFSCRNRSAADDHVDQAKERIKLMSVLAQSRRHKFPMALIASFSPPSAMFLICPRLSAIC